MDAGHAAALRAFISHHPSAAPIDPAAPDPLKNRTPERPLAPRPLPKSAATNGEDLLPLILAQLPLQRTYRWRPQRMKGR